MSDHLPVMLSEALTGLNVRAGGIYVDCTFGRGGHSAAILAALGGGGALHALDQDPQAVAHARQHFALHQNFTIHHCNFDKLRAVADEAGITGRIDGVLMDLGVSSPQLDDPARGFSFAEGPLDMRMDPGAGMSAADWLAQADEAEIAEVLWRYGDERNSRRIARRIVQVRGQTPITTTAQLAELVKSVPGPRSHKIHPATRTFQAIRIHVNRELEVLESALAQAFEVLAHGGRLTVISFHSLEDRIVKRFMRDTGSDARDAREPAWLAAAVSRTPAAGPGLARIGRYFPTDAECAANPRARSAVLRVAEKRREAA